jgi:ubiquitin-conjugating enzyme E2 variant
MERIAVVLFAGLWLAAFARLAPGLLDAPHGAVSLPGLLAGYLLADFVSGSVHWLADRYFAPSTPVIGPLLIAPFRDHHVDSSGMARHDFFEISGNNALVTLPVALGLHALPVPGPGSSSLALVGVGLALGLSGALFLTNQFHGWAHAARPPAAVRRLQAWGFILTPERHALHHRDGHDRAYCVTSGWLNPLLDGIGFFPALERWIDSVRSGIRRTT